MQLVMVQKYVWGHCVPDVEKGKLALALEQTSEALTPSSELIIVETTEDSLE